MSWQNELKNGIKTAEELAPILGWTAEETARHAEVLDRFPMLITPYYLSLVDPKDPDDPIGRMCIPSLDELDGGGSFDTSGEADNTKLEGMQHKYSQTVLLLSTNQCAMYCRHCFRKRLVTQFNHPRELTEEARRAVRALAERGVLVRNQTVLLRGVNDSGEVLGDLLSGLTRWGVVPYYIFQCRPVTGVHSRFQVPLNEGIRIVDEAKSRQNGFGKAVRYAMSHPLGKIEIFCRMPGGETVFKFHQSKYPENAARVFTANLASTDTWLDGELKGM